MPVHYYCSNPACPKTFDTIEDARNHDCNAGPDDPDARADGGTMTLDGEMKLEVVFSSGGVEFRSEPLDIQRAQEYSNALGAATVTVDGNQRPLCDDETAGVRPVEVDSDE